MQRLNRTILIVHRSFELTFVAAMGCLAGLGCGGTNGQPTAAVNDKPYQGMVLKFCCPDDRLRTILEPMVKVWAHQTGATIEVAADRMQPEASFDLGVVPFAELGSWADRGDLVPIPTALREPGHAYQWSSILEVYRGEAYAGWGQQSFGLPLAADGSLIVYRADRLSDPRSNEDYRKRFGRPLAAPATWEEFADIAAFFAQLDKRPSLPRFTADPIRLEDIFFRLAACYDRPARTGENAENPESLAFQFRLDNGKPRVDQQGFVAAGRWLAGLNERGCIPSAGSTDPASALLEDRAVLAVLTMAELRLLTRDGKINTRYGIAPLPGAGSFVNPATGTLAPTKSNYIPYFSGGWLGVVRRGSQYSDAAFALLAELGGPARGQEIIAAGGYGPLRDTHLESDRLLVWLGYGFDEPRSKALQDCLRSFLGKSVRNRVYGLRTPDQAKLREQLGIELAKIAANIAKSEDGLARAAEAWDRANELVPRDKFLGWRRRAVGLN